MAGRSFQLGRRHYSSIPEWCSTSYRPEWHTPQGSIAKGHTHSCSKEMARGLYLREDIGGLPGFDDGRPPPSTM
jgi:hypothetical protein